MTTQGKILIYKRNSKKGFSYTYRIEAGIDPKTGKRKQLTKSGFKTAKEARAAAQPILNKLLLGENIIESNITFSEYAAIWLADRKSNLKKSSQSNNLETIKIANRYFANLKMKSITPYMYQQFINHYGANVKLTTLKTRHVIIKNIFNYAVKYKLINSNPTTNVEFPRKNMKKIDINSLRSGGRFHCR